MQNNITKAELKMCALIVEHNIAFLTADHLGLFCKFAFHDSKIATHIACGRTKTTALIKNVLARQQFSNLRKKLNDNKFSICVDESTDLCNKKFLSVVARVSENFKSKDIFLCLLEVESCSADFLYTKVKQFFDENKIKYKQNMIGFAADGANNMTGINNSLASHLKRDIPHLIIFKCICHSLALCSSYACTKLPSEVECLLRNIYNYISNSPKRHYKLK